ncbi:vWA domain-containing protein [Montanilutibacter psychrotolerans]|uniref:VWA domain-containing protein n=1 Tax=Montanilutibacter psychrotolerans TaxID=1327343 RepID=A0A3M8SZ51_9GAMM|nr:VWA domain-containing protein [Lysobacter psychrotolerans]RNF86509.1 VWA domain-containing protein [Lysobacter psychrotolerans]
MNGLVATWIDSTLSLFDGIALAWPLWLLALPLPLLARWLLPAARDNAAALRVPWGQRLDAIAAGGGRSLRGGGAGALVWLAWALLCLAAARPQQLGEAQQPPQTGRDLMLALDLSQSMAEADMELGGRVVDRLTAAKAVLSDFLERRAGDRIGLLVFGERAYALTPLTLDRASVREQLDDSIVGLAGQATAIGDGIGLAVKRLHNQPAGQRVLILLTDGVNTAGALDPRKAAELARENGVRVHTIAFGGEGGINVFGIRLPMPGGDEIDETVLRAIAEETGGHFFRARDTGQLAGIYAQIDRIEPIERPAQAVRPRLERYPWPLGAALLLALIAFARPRRRA